MLTLVQSFAVENKKALMVFLGISILFAAMLIPALAVNAQQGPTNFPVQPGGFPFQRNVNNLETGVQTIVTRVANVAGFIIVALSILMILWSAFLFLTSGGDPAKITSARNYIIYALVGIAVALLAFALPTMVVRFFG